MEPKLVYVEWEDSCGGNARWTEIKDMEPNQPNQKSIGWLMHESDRFIVVVQHISSEPDHPRVMFVGHGEMTIPKSAILKQIEVNINGTTD